MDLALTAATLAAVDAPWLMLIGERYREAVRAMQGGRDAVFRPAAAVPAYVALAWLVRRASTAREAFVTGACTYAVYDFTVLALFKDYPLKLALADALWGGILCAAAFKLTH